MSQINRFTFGHKWHAFARRLPLFPLIMLLLLVSFLPASGQSNQAAREATTYLVQLADAPLATYQGGIAGLAPTHPATRGEVRLDPSSAASVAYLTYLAQQQDQFLRLAEQLLGRRVEVLFRYNAALNGLALRLTAEEANRVAGLPGVHSVQADQERELLTDNGPLWIGAPGVWDGSATGGRATQGEGVVIGVIDTGINHDHPSFADPGPVDGYNYPARTLHFGACAPFNPVLCNDKLIGIYDFTGTGPLDDNGHGSHTASTAGGNTVDADLRAPTTTFSRRISGVAPHANLISYKACFTTAAASGCLISSLLAAINQATLDGVDVINYSIGGPSNHPWSDLDALAFLAAREAGVFVATSAGNSGPGASTVGSPADAPWLMTVGASTHARKLTNALTGMSGGASPAPADIAGEGITSAYGPAAIVYAGAPPYNNPLCNPFPAGTFSGQIVVCDRGEIGRVQKSQNVKDAGGGGFVLANDAANGGSLIADSYLLPGVHISHAAGQTVKNWLATGSGHTASIRGLVAETRNSNGDIMASFSSRGPNPAARGVLKPDVTAPGVSIFAAIHSSIPAGPHPEYGVLSGTSMSSPHVAGAAALIRALYPTWTPAEVQSALMTTAREFSVRKEDGTTRADPFDMGSGRIDLSRAARAGLLLNEAEPNYTNADPAADGDPSTLNLASLANGGCTGQCTWQRTVRNPLDRSMRWEAATLAPAGMALRVTPGTFTLPPGGSQQILITADVSRLAANRWHFAEVGLAAADRSIPKVRLPLAVFVLESQSGPDTRRVLHFQGNLEEGCLGIGQLDVVHCNGPFLSENATLSPQLPAHWLAAPAVNGVADRNIYDPNWVWRLNPATPTVVEGPMTVEWWASCSGCSGVLSADWRIRVWADGVQRFEQRITATPALPALPSLLEVTVTLPRIEASNSIVLHVDPVYIDSQTVDVIHYDSVRPCLSGSQACDSLVRMPVISGGNSAP